MESTLLTICTAIIADRLLGELKSLPAWSMLTLGPQWLYTHSCEWQKPLQLLLGCVFTVAVLSTGLVALYYLPNHFFLNCGLLFLLINSKAVTHSARSLLGALQAHQSQLRKYSNQQAADNNPWFSPTIALDAILKLFRQAHRSTFGVVFWFAIAGLPGALAYRLVSSMSWYWYSSPKLLDKTPANQMGLLANWLNEIMDCVPRYLTAALYALAGLSMSAFKKLGRSPHQNLPGNIALAALHEEQPIHMGDLDKAIQLVDRAISLLLMAVLTGLAVLHYH